MNNRQIFYLAIYVFIGVCSAYIANDKQLDVAWVVSFPIWYFLLIMVIQLFDVIMIKKDTNIFWGSFLGAAMCFCLYSYADLIVIIYHNYVTIMYIILVMLAVISIFSIIIWNLLQFAKTYENIINIRKICIALYTISIIIGINCLYIAPICYIIKVCNDNKPVEFHFISCLMVFLPFLLAPRALLSSITEPYFSIRKKIHLTNHDLGNYALFLRCFKYDNSIEYEDTLYRISIALPEPFKILQIGNPQKIFKGFEFCETFYLPTIDWQKWVSYYINKTQFIFVVVNDSNGVLWEILNHDNQCEKFIFYFPQSTNIDSLFNNDIFKDSINLNRTIANILNKNRRVIKDNCYCFIKDNHLYNDNDIFRAIQKYFIVHKSLPYREWVINNCNNYVGRQPKPLKITSFLPLGPL